MQLLWRCGLLMGLLLLTGCFQQAGESLQSAGSTAAPEQINATTELIILTEIPAQGEGQVEEAASPTIAVTQPPVTGPTTPTMPPITIIFQPTDTPRPTAGSASLQSSDNTTPVGFITPGIPLGPGMEDVAPTESSSALGTTPSSVQTATTSDLPDGIDPECSYVIQRGDTVFGIALGFDTTVARLRELNPELTGDNPVIQPGQIIILPECNNIPTEVPPPTEAVEATGTSTAVPSVIEPVVPGTSATSVAETYIVQRGDTLFTIAQRYGTTVSALVAANNLSNPDRLSVGQRLIIPPRR